MKKLIVLFLTTVMLLGVSAFAEKNEKRNYEPEAGQGWMTVNIYGEPVELEFAEASKGLSGTTYIFQSEQYRVSIVFDRKLEVGKEMGENAINSIEVLSYTDATSGYYFTKKSKETPVDCEVMLEKKEDNGLWQGTFRVMVHTADRWLGDMKPGLIEDLAFENGEFCFCEK